MTQRAQMGSAGRSWAGQRVAQLRGGPHPWTLSRGRARGEEGAGAKRNGGSESLRFLRVLLCKRVFRQSMYWASRSTTSPSRFRSRTSSGIWPGRLCVAQPKQGS